MDYTITPELQAALDSMVEPLQTHGLAKLASQMLGVDVGADREVFAHIGTKLAMQRLEWQRINAGLAALKEL